MIPNLFGHLIASPEGYRLAGWCGTCQRLGPIALEGISRRWRTYENLTVLLPFLRCRRCGARGQAELHVVKDGGTVRAWSASGQDVTPWHPQPPP